MKASEFTLRISLKLKPDGGYALNGLQNHFFHLILSH